MAWSEQARRAAIEARRRKAKQKVVVTSARGKKVKVSRDLYAQKIRTARAHMREFRRPGVEKRYGSTFNFTARVNAGAYAAAHVKRETGARRAPRKRGGQVARKTYF